MADGHICCCCSSSKYMAYGVTSTQSRASGPRHSAGPRPGGVVSRRQKPLKLEPAKDTYFLATWSLLTA